jgi:hypothetical protein
MNERIKLPVSIRLGDLPEDVGRLLRAGNVVGELHLVAGTATIELFAIVDIPPAKPNATTIAAMQEAERGEFIGSFKTAKELLANLDGAED